MIQEKCIIIGCDERSISLILSNIKGGTSFSYNIISATKISDINKILTSVTPDLILLCFNDNHLAINDINSQIQLIKIPILCINKFPDERMMDFDQTNIVFNYPIEQLKTDTFLSSIINSIFLLKNYACKSSTSEAFFYSDFEVQKKQDLNRYVLELDQKIDVLFKVKARISNLYPKVNDTVRLELIAIVNSIKAGTNDFKFWNDFKLHFEYSDPAFLLLLTNKYPSLTPIDLRYCCYIKMNLGNDDIRNILGINQESVRTHKYRLKKKMALSKSQNLSHFLKSVTHLN